MKIVLLMYLEEDAPRVARLIRDQGVLAFSRLDAEGWTESLPSPWSGAVSPYRSQFLVTLVPDDRADRLMEAVTGCGGCEDDRHPIHAVELDVARVATSLTRSDRSDPTSPEENR